TDTTIKTFEVASGDFDWRGGELLEAGNTISGGTALVDNIVFGGTSPSSTVIAITTSTDVIIRNTIFSQLPGIGIAVSSGKAAIFGASYTGTNTATVFLSAT